MGLEQLAVHEVVKGAVLGAFNIPEFQRGFVWRSDQVRDLLESLYRDYPVGSMLVWDAKDYAEPHTAQGTQTSRWIVDGQQRTTALCIAFGSKPYWWPETTTWNEAIKKTDVLVSLNAPVGQPEFALTNPTRRHDPHWVSIRDILSCETDKDVTKLAHGIAGKRGISPTDDAYADNLSLLHTIWAIRMRIVPIVSVQHELEDVAEIFARLNQEGTRVTEADVTVALVAAANPGWVREEFLSYSESLKDVGFDLDPGVYIRTLTGVARGTARLKDVPRDFWRDEVRAVWAKVKPAVSHAVHLLQDRGVLSSQLLPSRNSLIPLFAFHTRFGKEISFDRVFAWFLLANADGRYSGSSTTILTQDLAAIRDAPSGTLALAALGARLGTSATFDASRFLEDYGRDRFGRFLVYLLLFNAKAVDWVSKARIGYDKNPTSLNEGFLPEWHHIYPRAVLQAAGRSDADCNLLANITVLNDATNRNKLRAKTPQQYIAEFAIKDEELRGHLIPAVNMLTIEGYDNFVTTRAENLARAAQDFFGAMSGNGTTGEAVVP